MHREAAGTIRPADAYWPTEISEQEYATIPTFPCTDTLCLVIKKLDRLLGQRRPLARQHTNTVLKARDSQRLFEFSVSRDLAIRLMAFVLFYLFLELLAFAALAVTENLIGDPYQPNISSLNEQQIAALTALVQQKSRTNHAIAPDPVLGWRPVIEANSAGMRDDSEYAREAAEGVLRIAAYGDSFTYASDVALKDSWGKHLMRLEPSIQLFNYGAPAYGLDQAFLRYRKNKQEYKTDIVLIGYMSENLARNVNVFRPFYSPAYRQVIFTKPRFELGDEELVLLPNPIASAQDQEYFLQNHERILPALGEKDYHYQAGYNRGPLDFSPLVRLSKAFYGLLQKRVLQPIFELNGMYSTRSEAYRVTRKIFDEFYWEVLAEDSLPVILIFPDTNDHRRSRAGQKRRYQPLLDYFDAEGYPYIDVMAAIEPHESRYSVDDLTVAWGHFSPLGNRIIAQYIRDYLEEKHLLDPNTVDIAVRRERVRLGI